jgi:cobyrinic acid a,c-diamide synthase
VLFRSVPERYLGLVPTTEGATAETYFAAAEAAVARGIDLDRLLAQARASSTPSSRTAKEAPGIFPSARLSSRAAIAVALDRAFSFYHQDSLDLLEEWGAELVPFSPLEDTSLPRGVSGIYVGGGFPELFAAELSANVPMLTALRDAQSLGLPIYAECGGLMALGRSLVDAEGRRHPMAAVVPLDSTLAERRLTIAYREAHAIRDTLLVDAGETIRAHEFHWSCLEMEPAASDAAYHVAERHPPEEGFAHGSTVASYLHLHFAADEWGRLPRRFVDRAASARRTLAAGSREVARAH